MTSPMMQRSDKITLLFTILFPLFLLFSVALLFVFTPFTYDILIDQYSTDKAIAQDITPTILDYFTDHSIRLLATTQLSNAEAEHLEDVRKIILLLTLITLSIGSGLIALRKSIQWNTLLQRGSITTLAVIIIGTLVPFQFLFTWFHYLFFPQGNWQFSASSTLIQSYPANFFLAFAIIIASATGILAIGLYCYSRKRSKNSSLNHNKP